METKEAMILRDRFDERAQRERLVKAQRFIGIWRLMAVQVNIKKLIDSKIIDEAMAEVRAPESGEEKRKRESCDVVGDVEFRLLLESTAAVDTVYKIYIYLQQQPYSLLHTAEVKVQHEERKIV